VSGVLFPDAIAHKARNRSGTMARLKEMAFAGRFFLALVVAPTAAAGVYYAAIASDQYESSVDFIVRRAETGATTNGFGQLLGFSLGSTASSSEAYLVQQYLLSHDAVARLRKEDDLVGVFQREGTDPISRLWFSDPAPERLLKFYRKQVAIAQDDTSGISHMTVHTFRPEDSYRIATKLLQMGEQQINRINLRTYNDQVSSSQRELDEANRQLIDIQTQLTAYRREHEDIDPADSGKAQISLVTGLTANLVAARAKLQAMAGVVPPSSPQYQAMNHQIQALSAQVAAQSAKIAGPNHSVAARLSDYEQLVIKREQVAKVYATAAVQYENAKAEARRKQLYLVRIDEPNMPVKSEFPKRFTTVLTVFAALFVAYAIGWLLWAGVREHSL